MYLCCDARTKARGLCGVAQVSESVRTLDFEASNDTWYHKVPFPSNATSVAFNPPKWLGRRSGVYSLFVTVCSEALQVDTISGQVQFVNPYGYLPAYLYGHMPFWFWMLVSYGVAGAVWLLLSLRNWRELMHLQMCISGILFVGMVDACSWNVFYANWNESGQVSVASAVIVSAINTGKRGLSRMLVLVVSMGYGVVLPRLGARVNRVLVLGAVYFVFGTLLSVVEWLGHSEELGVGTRLVFVVPVAVLDSLFSVWIFSELSATVTQLQARNQRTKLQLYRRFTRIVGALVLVSLLWSSYEVYATSPAGTPFERRWRSFWALEAAWPLLYFVVLLAIMWLWAPSKNAVRYAYSEELALDSEDEDYIDGLEMGEAEAGKTSHQSVHSAIQSEDGHERRVQTQKPSVEARVFALLDADSDEDRGDGKMV